MSQISDFQLTEAGLIPCDWDVSTVGAEFDVALGKMLDAKKNVGTDKPYIGNRAVLWGRIDVSDLATIPITAKEAARFRLRRGDIVACEGGEVGRAAIWKAPIEECYYQKALHRLRPNRGFDPSLLVAFLQRWNDTGAFANYVTQTSIAHLPREKFVTMPLPVPPPDEQRAIAKALSDVDALLEGLDQLIAKKRDIKQAAMQQLLTGQTRLPGFDGEWEMMTIRDFAPLQRGFDLPTRQIKSGNYPVVYSNGILNHHESYQVRGPGVVTGRSGTIGNVTYVPENYWPHNTSLWVTDFKGNDPKFVFYVYGRLKFERFSSGSGVPTLNRNDVHDFEITAPTDRREQSAIAGVLDDMDFELRTLQDRRTKTAHLKQAMMQELLTGRTRLVEPASADQPADS